MISSTSTVALRAVSVSVTGRGHRSEGDPVRMPPMHLRARGVHAIAVANRAGSAARAEVGATVAVRTLRKFFKRRFHRLRRMPEKPGARHCCAGDHRPPGPGPGEGRPVGGDYATTLLFAATDGEILLWPASW